MGKMIRKNRHDQRGVVSLFVVIFSALLLTVLTISFVRAMIKEQQQAMNNDLSQSAYDSAVAGVEDGKRVIRKCLDGDSVACAAITNKSCDTVSDAGIVPSIGGETTIKSSGGTEMDSLNQAYTCVKIEMNTDDFYTDLTKDQSKLIPLRATKPFSSIRIQWMHKDLQGQAESGTLTNPTANPLDLDSLPAEKDWSSSAASLIRAQPMLPLVNPGDMIKQSDYDSNMTTTVFLRPAGINKPAGSINPAFTIATNRAAGFSDMGVTLSPQPVPCSKAEYAAGGLASGYACNATLKLSAGSVPASSTLAYLRLTSMYRDTTVRIQLYDDAGVAVQFEGVQPQVDSTGRASNVFRRVVSKVNTITNSPAYPEYAIDSTGSLCKDFYVTADPGSANSGVTCSTAP